MSQRFSDDDLANTCREVHNPLVDGWEPFCNTHGTKIWKLYDDKSGLYEWKILSEVPDVEAETAAQVYADHDYRKSWDSYVAELRPIEQDGVKGVYWNVRYPFPLSNRDYTYVSEQRLMELEGVPYHVSLASSCEFRSVPAVSGVVRVTKYSSRSALTSNGSGGTKAFMHYFDDPGGSIPKWLINWFASTGVSRYMDMVFDACRKYPTYKRQLTDKQH